MSTLLHRPTAGELVSECKNLPDGWIVDWSDRMQRRYYYRAQTSMRGERTQWHKPTEQEEADRDRRRKERATADLKRKSNHHHHHHHRRSRSPRRHRSRSNSVHRSSHTHSHPSRRSRTRSRSSHRTSPERHHRHKNEDRHSDRKRSESPPPARTSNVNGFVPKEEDHEHDWGAEEQPNKRRRGGLGYEENGSSSFPHHPPSHGAMSFVSAGGRAANTPASIHASLSTSNASASASSASSRRIESASRPSANVADPPVYPTSLQAVLALTAHGPFKQSQWSDPAKYHSQLASTKIITVNNVYNTRDATLIEKLLQAEEALPPPAAKHFEEEPPSMIIARRDAFNSVDASLTNLVQTAGLRQQPTMCFLRWGFNQRSLQNPSLSYEEVDPLLPMDPTSTDACLMMELLREKLSHKNSNEICAQLAERCKKEAHKLIELRKKLMSSENTEPIHPFTLLYPHESHLHTDSSSASNAMGGSGNVYRANDRQQHNQSAREQHWIIYDHGGKQEWAIPLNHQRFTQLQHDYERTIGPIGALTDTSSASAAPIAASESRIKGDQIFLRRLWSMMARYDTISGAGYQAALPEDGFNALRDHWGVEHECYASPLNHCLDSFGSAFIDTDRFFGSKGQYTHITYRFSLLYFISRSSPSHCLLLLHCFFII
jgi:hypothetical protein